MPCTRPGVASLGTRAGLGLAQRSKILNHERETLHSSQPDSCGAGVLCLAAEDSCALLVLQHCADHQGPLRRHQSLPQLVVTFPELKAEAVPVKQCLLGYNS